MNAFLYVLRCNGGKYYVGSTEDLERRMKEHAAGRGCAFTKAHLPFELVYTEEHPSYESAYERERQVHKWSRAKKERLIKGKLPYMRHLSTNTQAPIDMGDWSLRDSKGYRVPADNRGLNYDKFFKEGETERNTLTEFNSDNTTRLNLEEKRRKLHLWSISRKSSQELATSFSKNGVARVVHPLYLCKGMKSQKHIIIKPTTPLLN